MIGHLQSNKAARAVRLFHAIDSVDSFALAERLDRAKKDFNTAGTEKRTEKGSEKAETVTGLGGETPPGGGFLILIEVKLDPGSTKSGVRSTELPGLVESVLRLPHLELRGLMGVPPYSVDSEKARPFFHRLREMQEILRTQMGRELVASTFHWDVPRFRSGDRRGRDGNSHWHRVVRRKTKGIGA